MSGMTTGGLLDLEHLAFDRLGATDGGGGRRRIPDMRRAAAPDHGQSKQLFLWANMGSIPGIQ